MQYSWSSSLVQSTQPSSFLQSITNFPLVHWAVPSVSTHFCSYHLWSIPCLLIWQCLVTIGLKFHVFTLEFWKAFGSAKSQHIRTQQACSSGIVRHWYVNLIFLKPPLIASQLNFNYVLLLKYCGSYQNSIVFLILILIYFFIFTIFTVFCKFPSLHL